jgi:hypothetical protein
MFIWPLPPSSSSPLLFSHSWIGKTLYDQLIAANAAPWVIAVTGYFGTTFTEAASWATAVSHPIQQLDSIPLLQPGHSVAEFALVAVSLVTSRLGRDYSGGGESALQRSGSRHNFPSLPGFLVCRFRSSCFVFYAVYFSIFR